MNRKMYKAYSLQEFNKAAEKFDDNDPSVYNMCRKEYPDILEELEKEEFHDILDAGCGTGAVLYLLNKKYPDRCYTGIDLSDKMIEVPLLKKLLHKGDVHVYSRREIQKLCEDSGLQMERFEQRKGFRLHSVCRKPGE